MQILSKATIKILTFKLLEHKMDEVKKLQIKQLIKHMIYELKDKY